MFKKTLVNIEAVIDMPRPFWVHTLGLEQQAKVLEEEAKDLTAFLKDHRSRDDYAIEIRRQYKSFCSFCGSEEERDSDGSPVCCSEAISEYQAGLEKPVPPAKVG